MPFWLSMKRWGEAMGEKDILFLLSGDFAADGADHWFCPDCAPIEGLLAYYPELKGQLDIRYVDFARPRQAMTALVDAAVEQAKARVDHARSRLRLLSPAALVEQGFLRVDEFANRLAAALRNTVQTRRHRLAET